MLSHIIQDREFGKLYYAHSVRDGAVHAYRNRVGRAQHHNSEKMKYLRVYTKPRSVDKKVRNTVLFSNFERALIMILKVV